jgi:uncharacterized oxidoreductase
MNLEGNTILITGGTRGIGLQMAREFLKRNNAVIVTGRDPATLDRAKKELPGLHALQSDVSQVADIEALHAHVAAHFPNLNVLVNNAGEMRTINLHDDGPSLDDLTREIDINFKGPVRMTKRFLPDLKERPRAAIVNVSSGLAFVPLPINPIYCATKAAMHSFTLSLRAQLKGTKVEVFELAPPATATDLLGDPNSPDLKGVPVMKVEDMVRRFLEGMGKDELEICPGPARSLKLMSRLAPKFILAQLSKPVDRMLRSHG